VVEGIGEVENPRELAAFRFLGWFGEIKSVRVHFYHSFLPGKL
jgi:hypothetical protein